MKLFVKTIEFGIIELLVRKDENIKEIKENICGKIELNVNLLNLCYNGEILEDDKTLNNYEIINNSVINIVNILRGGMRIFVENNEKIFAFEIEQNEKIINAKLQIFESLRIDDNYFYLVYKDKIFDGYTSLIEFGIWNKSLINVVRKEIKILAKTDDGKMTEIYLERIMEILEMKNKIQEKLGLLSNEQQLMYQSQILNDDKTIDEYQISNKSVINVSKLKNKMQIFVNKNDGQTLRFEVLKSDKIIDIKHKIQEKLGWRPNEQILRFHEKILEDHETIDEYKIVEKSVINIGAKLRNEMQINAKTMDGQTYIVKVVYSEKIIDLKQKIQEQIGLHPDEQLLVYQGELLDDEKTIDESQIVDKSVINVVRKLRGQMQIFAKTQNGKTITFEVVKSEKIIDIKKKIQDKIGLHRNEQILKYQNEILKNEKTVSEYQIVENSLINVIGRLRKIQIIFKTIDEKSISVDVKKLYKIRDTKRKIKKKIRLDRNDKLIYNGVILVDNKTIDEYQICENSVINIINKSKIEIMINLEIFDGRQFKLCAEKQTKIIDIKKQIEMLIDLYPIKQNLYYQDVLLEGNEDTLEEIQSLIKIKKASIKKIPFKMMLFKPKEKQSSNNEMTISVELSNDWLEIFVETTNQIQYKLCVKKFETILDIKCKIHQEVNEEPNEQILFFNELILENNKTVEQSNIVDKAVLRVEFNIKNFIKAIKSGSIEKVQMRYEKVFLEMKYGSYSRYPIHYACKYGLGDIVKYLIEKGCNLEAADSENRRPIHYVCAAGNVELLNILIQHNVNIEASDLLNRRPIHIVCFNGNLEILNILIENKCDKEACDNQNRRPIHYSCTNGNVKIIEFLIENNCDIESKDDSNHSPLMIAQENNSGMVIEILNKELRTIQNIRKVADAMELKCNGFKCDHKFCYTSMLRKQLTGKEINNGTYGRVYRCKESETSREFVYKKLKEINSCIYIEENINDFIVILKHVRIIKYFGGFEIKTQKFIFMEYLEAGSLQDRIGKPNITLVKIICYTEQILEALEFLHGNEIIHRDIKPDNAVVDGNENVKLIDFGLSLPLSKISKENPQKGVPCGTYGYMAPEITSEETYSCSVDIWSLGITVIEMATGKRFHRSVNHDAFINGFNPRTIEYQLPDSLPHSHNLKLFIDEILISDGISRPSATELLSKLNEYFPNYLFE